jgi:hypothetical protein
MKKLLFVALLLAATTVVFGQPPASAHNSPYHRYLGYTGSHNGSMIDNSILMTCPVDSGYGSIVYAATQWDGNIFGPNNYVPWYTWGGTSCNTVMSNSWPIIWNDFNEYYPGPPTPCTLGRTRMYGPRLLGEWGICVTPPSSSFCNNAEFGEIQINVAPSAGQNPPSFKLQQTAVHELGHPIGLGEYPGNCNPFALSIMNYKCMDPPRNLAVPEAHDYSDVFALY